MQCLYDQYLICPLCPILDIFCVLLSYSQFVLNTIKLVAYLLEMGEDNSGQRCESCLCLLSSHNFLMRKVC